jgi:hypothetical protein
VTVRVSFLAEDPRLAKTVTERLLSAAIDEHLRDSVRLAESAEEIVEASIEDARNRIIDAERSLEAMRGRSPSRPLSQADVLPYEVLQERYRALLIRREELRTAAA